MRDSIGGNGPGWRSRHWRRARCVLRRRGGGGPDNRRLVEFAEALQHRPDHERAHLHLVAKTHLALRRMHVDVHRRRIEVEKEERQGVAPLRDRLVVAFNQRIAQRATVHRPLVHEGDHLVARGPSHPGASDQSPQPEPGLFQFHRQQRLRDLPPEYLRHPLGRRGAFGRTEDRAFVLNQRERRLRAGQRIKPHAMDDVRAFGGVTLEEFPPGRHGIEELRHHDPRADRPAAVADMQPTAPVDEDFRARLRCRRRGSAAQNAKHWRSTGRASPRKPNVASRSRSPASAILLVACRSRESWASSRSMPAPLSSTRI